MESENNIIVFARKIFDEFVYGGHLAALGISGLVLSIILLHDLPINLIILIIPYLSTQVVYSYNHIKELNDDITSNPERTIFIANQKNRANALLYFYVLLLFLTLFFSNIGTALFVICIVVGGILYTDYFKGHITKYILGFKNLYTSLLLASSIFIIPLFYRENNFVFFLCLFVIVFIRLIVNTVFFDIKDIEMDNKKKLKTLPVVYGVRKTIVFLIIIDFLSVIPLLLGISYGYIPKTGLAIIFFTFYSVFYLAQGLSGNEKRIRLMSYLIADAEYVVWPLIIILGKLILN